MSKPQNQPEDVWTAGYSARDLEAAQERFGLTFPPDLKNLLLERRPVRGFDWRTDDAPIQRALKWPLEGLLFDVEQNGLWWPEWGKRPDQALARAEIVTNAVRTAPPLIPIIGHRYLPSEPGESGNPVFSVYQSDIIYYGRDLADYFERELNPSGMPFAGPTRYIPFWSDMVDRAYKEPFYPTALESGSDA